MSSSRQIVARDRGIRHGDISGSTDTSGTVTLTVGTGDDHQHLELTPDQAITLADILGGLTEWEHAD